MSKISVDQITDEDGNGAPNLVNGIQIAGVAVSSTAAEINLIDGGTARGTTALADGDGILINDAGTMRMSTVQTVKTYMTAGFGSTTYGAVGTYTTAMRLLAAGSAEIVGNSTVAGSALLKWDDAGQGSRWPLQSASANTGDTSSAGLSGTWKMMSPSMKTGGTARVVGSLYLRIS